MGAMGHEQEPKLKPPWHYRAALRDRKQQAPRSFEWGACGAAAARARCPPGKRSAAVQGNVNARPVTSAVLTSAASDFEAVPVVATSRYWPVGVVVSSANVRPVLA